MLQPRVTPSLPTGREGSVFQRVFSSASGIDPYAFAVSDVYQDLFGEGSYSGKGIYDIDIFEAALSARVPDNTLLSHDLLEGIFARAGLVSDIEVVEEFPSRYDVAAARQHRWARGDWQLLPWILGCAHGSSSDRGATAIPDTPAAIPLIGRWKMIDNLRRTLSAPAAFLALIAGWTLAPAAAGIWTGFVLATLAMPAMLPFLTGLVPRRLGISKRSHARAVGADLAVAASQIAMLVTLLAHQAWLMSDAIVRTLYRLFVSHRRMLEWVTAAQAKLTTHLDLRGFYGSDGRRRRARRRGRGLGRVRRTRSRLDRGSVRNLVDAFAGRRAMGESSAAIGRVQTASRRRRPGPQTDRTPHMALLRDVCDGGRQHASARQLPGGPEARAGSSNVPHQPRAVPAVRDSSARFRLDRYARDRGSDGSDPRDDDPARTFSRALLQLVRHTRSASAGPKVRLFSG